MNVGATRRSDSGNARATYRPDWDALRPWHLYVRGSALPVHYATERGAIYELERRGFSFRHSVLIP